MQRQNKHTKSTKKSQNNKNKNKNRYIKIMNFIFKKIIKEEKI